MRRIQQQRSKQIVIAFMVCTVLLVGCVSNPQEESVSEVAKPVRTMKLSEETKNQTIRYTGNVVIKDTKTFAFKTSGKITDVIVEKGKWIKVGEALAKLDTTDLEFARQAAEGKVQAAASQYEKAVNGATPEDIEQLRINLSKAEDAFQYTDDLYRRMEELFSAGAISENERDKVKLERDVRENDRNQARVALQTALNGTRPEDIAMANANLSMAQTDLSYKQTQINDATLFSDMEGYVAEIIQKEGTFVSAGYPVIALRGDAKIIKTGIARQDIDKIRSGGAVDILVGEQVIPGIISHISDIPDEYTRTYEIEITPDESGGLSIGSIVELDIIVGIEKGIWIPISAILSEGQDYVYLVEEHSEISGDKNDEKENFAKRAMKKEVIVESTKGTDAKVRGLSPSQELIVEGMRSIKENQPVTMIGEQQ